MLGYYAINSPHLFISKIASPHVLKLTFRARSQVIQGLTLHNS